MPVLDEAKVELTITSASTPPDEISRHIGLPADEGWHIGDRKGRSGLRWDKHVWRLWESEQASHEQKVSGELLDRCWQRFCTRVAPFAGRIRSLAADHSVEVGTYPRSETVPRSFWTGPRLS